MDLRDSESDKHEYGTSFGRTIKPDEFLMHAHSKGGTCIFFSKDQYLGRQYEWKNVSGFSEQAGNALG